MSTDRHGGNILSDLAGKNPSWLMRATSRNHAMEWSGVLLQGPLGAGMDTSIPNGSGLNPKRIGLITMSRCLICLPEGRG